MGSSRETEFHNAPEVQKHLETLGRAISTRAQALPGEKRGSRRERNAPLLPYTAHACECAVFVSSRYWVSPSGDGRGWRLRAVRPAAKGQQPAEPVGAVDEDDLLKAGSQ